MTAAGASLARSSQVVASDVDVVTSRQKGRQIAADMGFSRPDQALIATAIAELARNIVHYAGSGQIDLAEVLLGGRTGLRILATDNGPGIPDISAAMCDGFSTGNSLGLGLPGTRRIVDEFDLQSAPGKGVRVTAIKWL